VRSTVTPYGPVRKDAAGHTEEDAHYRYTWNAAGDLSAVLECGVCKAAS
jgi:hypothetical protein